MVWNYIQYVLFYISLLFSVFSVSQHLFFYKIKPTFEKGKQIKKHFIQSELEPKSYIPSPAKVSMSEG